MISTIITAFNSETYLSQAIESVLAQTLAPDEILVVDDGSKDGTGEVTRRYADRVQYFWQPNRGPGGARMSGIQRTSGEFLAFLDADDVWMPHKIELQYAALQADSDLDIVFPHLQQFLSPDLAPEVAATLLCDETTHPAPLISGFFTRRSVFDRVGPLRTDVKAEFLDWYMRAQEAGIRMLTLKQVLVKRRVHPDNFTLHNKDVRHEYLSLLKASLDRRRAAQKRASSPAPAAN